MGKPGINMEWLLLSQRWDLLFKPRRKYENSNVYRFLESIERRKCHMSQIVVMAIIAINN